MTFITKFATALTAKANTTSASHTPVTNIAISVDNTDTK